MILKINDKEYKEMLEGYLKCDDNFACHIFSDISYTNDKIINFSYKRILYTIDRVMSEDTALWRYNVIDSLIKIYCPIDKIEGLYDYIAKKILNITNNGKDACKLSGIDFTYLVKIRPYSKLFHFSKKRYDTILKSIIHFLETIYSNIPDYNEHCLLREIILDLPDTIELPNMFKKERFLGAINELRKSIGLYIYVLERGDKIELR